MIPARVAILGAGRAGRGVASAVISIGSEPLLVDEKGPSADGGSMPVKWNWNDSIADSGCEWLVVSPGVPPSSPTVVRSIKEGVEILSEVEFAYRISKAPIVGITGTNGKSTTTALTWTALSNAGHDAILCGNIAGSGLEEASISEAAARASEGSVLVAEVSSFQLEWVRDFRPAVGGLTNVSPDHMDRYSSFDEYRGAKLRLFAQQGSRDFAVVPDGHSVPGSAQRLTFGDGAPDATVGRDEVRILETRIDIGEVTLIGRHNHTNLAMAGLLCWAYSEWSGGSSGRQLADPVVEVLKRFPGIEHRMEVVGEARGIKLVNNSMCTNPAAVVASASALTERAHLLVGGKDKNLDFQPLREHLRQSQNQVVLFGSSAEQIRSQLGGGWQAFETMQEAFEAAIRSAKPGEVVMLAPGCASMDQFEDFRHRGAVFKAMAKEWLEHAGREATT